jgi:cholesterol transport system auxiliary component
VKRIWFAALVAAAGCVDLKSAYPEKRLYTLEASRTAPARTGLEATVLRVRRFTASKLAEGSEFVTRTGESEYESDFYNVFFVPPAAQAMEQAHRWLGSSRLFGSVVGTGSSIAETHVLEGNLVALHGDRRDRNAPRAVLELQFVLVGVASDPAAVLMQKSYRQETVLAKDDAESLVRAWNEGLAKILASLEEDLSKVDRSVKK